MMYYGKMENNMSWVGDTLLLSDQEIGCVLGQGGDLKVVK